MRISELAKELGIESKVVIAYLDSEGHGGYKAANKIEGYLEEMVRDHFPTAKKEEPETAKPKAILRRGNRERSFIPRTKGRQSSRKRLNSPKVLLRKQRKKKLKRLRSRVRKR